MRCCSLTSHNELEHNSLLDLRQRLGQLSRLVLSIRKVLVRLMRGADPTGLLTLFRDSECNWCLYQSQPCEHGAPFRWADPPTDQNTRVFPVESKAAQSPYRRVCSCKVSFLKSHHVGVLMLSHILPYRHRADCFIYAPSRSASFLKNFQGLSCNNPL